MIGQTQKRITTYKTAEGVFVAVSEHPVGAWLPTAAPTGAASMTYTLGPSDEARAAEVKRGLLVRYPPGVPTPAYSPGVVRF